MSKTVKFKQIEEKIISIRGQQVILDSDVAILYGVETRDINKSVKNNPDKFPSGYVLELNKEELNNLRWKFSTANLAMTRVPPKAFTEKGMYMLATILKGEQATQTTIEIIEVFAKIRELSRAVSELSQSPDEPRQKSLMQRSGEIMADILGDELQVTDTETSIEINFAVMKFKHTVRRKGAKSNQQ